MNPMYGQQPQQLPDVLPSAFIQGVPHRAPFIPQIPVRPQVAQMTADMCAHLIYAIQLYANNDPCWKALFWTASQNGFQNPFFMEWLGRAMEAVECKIAMERVPPQNAIPATATETASIMASFMLSMNPGLRQMLTFEQQSVQDGWTQFAAQLGNRVAAYINATTQMQPYGAPQYGNPNYGMMPNSGMGARGAGGTGAMYNQVNQGGYSSPMAAYQPPQLTYNNPPMGGQPNRAGYGAPAHVMGNRNVTGDGAWGPGGSQQPAPTARSATPPPVPANYEYPDDIKPITATTTTPTKVEHVIEEFHMDGNEVTIVDSKRRELAIGSELTHTPNALKPYGVLFDPRCQVCYYETAGNRTYQVVEDMEPGVDYHQHETEPFFKPRSKLTVDVKREYAEAQAAFKDIINQKNIDVRLEEFNRKTQGIVVPEGEQPPTIDQPTFIESPIVTIFEGDDRTEVTAHLQDENIPLELDTTVLTCTIYRINRTMYKGELATKIAELMNTSKWSVLHQRVVSLFEIYPESRWNVLHDDLTKAVNDYLKYQLDVPTRISSFVDDILDLPDYIESKYGGGFSDIFENACKKISASTLTTVSNKSEEYRQAFGDADIETYQCARVKIECVTFLPIDSIDLSMQYIGNQARIDKEGHFATLWKAIDTVFAYKADQGVPYHNTRFVTRDGEELYLMRSEFSESYILWKGR